MVENVDREADEREVEAIQIRLAVPGVKRSIGERIASTYLDDAIHVGNAYALGQLGLRRALRQMRVSLMIAEVSLADSNDNDAVLDLALSQMRDARDGTEGVGEAGDQVPHGIVPTDGEGATCSC